MNIDKLVQDWKEEIELINIDGFSKKVSSIDINKLLIPESFNEKDSKGNTIPVFIGICTTVCGGCRFKMKALNKSGLRTEIKFI